MTLSTPLNIGSIALSNRVLLAPMSGVTDMPFRQLAYEAGAGLVFSEMVASKELCQAHEQSQKRLSKSGNGLTAVQLLGCEPKLMAKAAYMAECAGADIIDINMGCPAKKVTGSAAGAALMRDLTLAEAIIEAVTQAVAVPVTLKMRLGWDDETLNAPQLAKIAQNLGVAMISVHGRTRAQFYKEKASWDGIKRVRDVVDVPFIANGDIASQTDAAQILAYTGADGVMVGRACCGAPWLAGRIAGHEDKIDIKQYMIGHYKKMLQYYGEGRAIRHARKHLSWYIEKHFSDCVAKTDRDNLLKQKESGAVIAMLEQIIPERAI